MNQGVNSEQAEVRRSANNKIQNQEAEQDQKPEYHPEVDYFPITFLFYHRNLPTIPNVLIKDQHNVFIHL